MADVDINLRVKSDDAPVKSTALKFTELASKVQLAQQAFAVIKRVVSETVGTFTTYAKTVEDMARVTGSGAEETSRLIQVADDLQISATDLSTALAGAVRKGINPSVDSIAALSDEYLALGAHCWREVEQLHVFALVVVVCEAALKTTPIGDIDKHSLRLFNRASRVIPDKHQPGGLPVFVGCGVEGFLHG